MVDIVERARQMIGDKAGVDPSVISSGTRLDKDLGLDSLDQVELVMGLEELAGLEVSDEEAEKLNTFGDVERFLREKGAK